MYIAANFLIAIAKMIDILMSLYMWIIIGRVIISWVNADPYNAIVRFLITATEPVLYQIRKRLPPLGGLDFSPFLLILAIIFVQNFLVQSLLQMASRMG